MANGLIKDKQLRVSSAWGGDSGTHGAHRARLNIASWPQGWTAGVGDAAPWLQVDLEKDTIITQVATQGYGGQGVEQWVDRYRLTWENGLGQWLNYTVPRLHRKAKGNWRTKVSTRFMT